MRNIKVTLTIGEIMDLVDSKNSTYVKAKLFDLLASGGKQVVPHTAPPEKQTRIAVLPQQPPQRNFVEEVEEDDEEGDAQEVVEEGGNAAVDFLLRSSGARNTSNFSDDTPQVAEDEDDEEDYQPPVRRAPERRPAPLRQSSGGRGDATVDRLASIQNKVNKGMAPLRGLHDDGGRY